MSTKPTLENEVPPGCERYIRSIEMAIGTEAANIQRALDAQLAFKIVNSKAQPLPVLANWVTAHVNSAVECALKAQAATPAAR